MEVITDLEDKDMKQWYFDIDAFKPELGFEFGLTGINEGKLFRHRCVVTEVKPGRKISFSWSYEGYPGISFVHFELFPEGGGTRLKLTHEGLESFPQHMTDFSRKNFVQGWGEIINTLLAKFLEKEEIS
jgi:uncharacterized protein YndB with AHSA1/START domain